MTTEHPSAAPPSRRRWVAAAVAAAALVLFWIWRVHVLRDPDFVERDRVRGLALNIAVTFASVVSLYLLFGGGRAAARVAKIVLLCGTLAVTLGLLELPALLFGHNYETTLGTLPLDTWTQFNRELNRPDPQLLHVHWPGRRYEGELAGNLVRLGIATDRLHPYTVEYDHQGFRNDTDLERADIAVIGDSFVEAALTPLSDTVAKQIERLTSQTTANLGQSGYGIQQELIVLERYALPLAPKTVLWFFYEGNDLQAVEVYEEARRSFREGRLPVKLRDRLLIRNALTLLARTIRPRRTADSRRALEQSGVFERADGGRDRVYFAELYHPWKAVEWETLTSSLIRARDLCREAGARFVVVYVPRKFRVYAGHVDVDPSHAIARWTLHDLPARLEAWCGTQEIELVDTVPALRAAAARGEHTYFLDDGHWNTLGNHVAAEAVAEHLRAK